MTQPTTRLRCLSGRSCWPARPRPRSGCSGFRFLRLGGTMSRDCLVGESWNPAVTCHKLCVTCHLTQVIWHLSPDTSHLTKVTCHLTQVTVLIQQRFTDSAMTRLLRIPIPQTQDHDKLWGRWKTNQILVTPGQWAFGMETKRSLETDPEEW